MSQGTGVVVLRIVSTQPGLSMALRVIKRLMTPMMSMQEPKKGYQLHHMTNENMQ